MIKFNNVDMTDIAPVKIEDVVVSTIQLNPVARQRAIKFGADFIRNGGGVRTVTISFALLDIDSAEREMYMQDIRSWAFTEEEKTLELPQFDNRHLECVCTQFPDYSYRKWWENKLKIVFTCFSNPFWTSNEPIEVPCGTPFSIGGSAQPLVSIFRSGVTSLTMQTYTNGEDAMTFSTIPAGQLSIDLNRKLAQIGNTSIMRYYVPTSSWITPKIGANQYINGVGTVRYRERWV